MPLEDKLKDDVIRGLVKKARLVTKDSAKRTWDKDLTDMLEREIAFTLEEIDRLKELHEKIRRKLSKLECYLGTDILKLEPRYHHAVDEYRQERQKLKKEIWRLEEERLHLAMNEEEKLQKLHRQLLTLLSKLDQLRL